MKKFFSDFKKFITRGNVVDMAIGVIVASAFTAIVTALTNGIIMPFINYLLSLGGTGLDSAYTFLKKVVDETGAVDLANSIYIDWGSFITAIINFLLVAFVLFCILRIFMRSKGFLQKQIYYIVFSFVNFIHTISKIISVIKKFSNIIHFL